MLERCRGAVLLVCFIQSDSLMMVVCGSLKVLPEFMKVEHLPLFKCTTIRHLENKATCLLAHREGSIAWVTVTAGWPSAQLIV